MCNQAPMRIAESAPSEPAKAPLPIQQIPGTTLAKVDNKDGKFFWAKLEITYRDVKIVIFKMDL